MCVLLLNSFLANINRDLNVTETDLIDAKEASKALTLEETREVRKLLIGLGLH
jgi:hypothetical protein